MGNCNEITLVPQQFDSHAIEQVLMLDNQNYPVALFHIDLLWTTPEHRAIHEKLSAGQTVICEMRLREVRQ